MNFSKARRVTTSTVSETSLSNSKILFGNYSDEYNPGSDDISRLHNLNCAREMNDMMTDLNNDVLLHLNYPHPLPRDVAASWKTNVPKILKVFAHLKQKKPGVGNVPHQDVSMHFPILVQSDYVVRFTIQSFASLEKEFTFKLLPDGQPMLIPLRIGEDIRIFQRSLKATDKIYYQMEFIYKECTRIIDEVVKKMDIPSGLLDGVTKDPAKVLRKDLFKAVTGRADFCIIKYIEERKMSDYKSIMPLVIELELASILWAHHREETLLSRLLDVQRKRAKVDMRSLLRCQCALRQLREIL